MGKPSTTQSVTELIEPVLREQNLELVEVKFKKAGKKWFLRVFIDKDTGVGLADCQKASRAIEDLIEVNDAIDAPYVLEVSSPGLDRPLKKERDFLKFKDKRIRVHTYAPVEDRKEFSGTIRDFKDRTLFLEDEGVVVQIPLDNIAQAKLIIEF
ncbi:MAG: ribosome maturation factor RimP [Nitrospinaceae bacterium]